MNCREVLEIASQNAPLSAEVRRHLESCAACAQEIEHMTDVDARVREALLSEEIDTSRVEAKVRSTIAPSRRWMGIAAGIAAALVVAIAAQWNVVRDRTYAAAAVDHHREVVNHERRNWLTDMVAIAELAGKRGIFIPQLAQDGYRLQRAKLCRLNGTIYLHAIFTDAAGAEMSLFLGNGGAGDSPVRTYDSSSEHVAYFETARAKGIVVSNGSKDAAAQMAQSAERAL